MTPLKLTPHETRRRSSRRRPSSSLVEVTYGEPGKPPPKHLHPAQDEHFEVLVGRADARRSAGTERVLRAGETLDIPRGTVAPDVERRARAGRRALGDAAGAAGPASGSARSTRCTAAATRRTACRRCR